MASKAAKGALDIRADRDELADGMARSMRAVSSRSASPVLQGLLCETEGRDLLRITGSSLDVTIRTSVEVNVVSPGRCVLPAKLINDVLRKMPPGSLVISSKSGAAEISGLDAGEDGPRFSVRAMNAADYPELEEPDMSGSVSIDGDELAQAISQVILAASSDEARPILSGVQIEGEGGGMRMAATDSYRLAVRDLPDVKIKFKGLVPAKGLGEMERAVGAEEVEVAIGDRNAVFSSERGTLILRLIDGAFPKYRQLLPDDNPNHLVFSKARMLEAIGRAAVVAEDHIPITLKVGEAGAALSVSRVDVGSGQEVVPGEFSSSSGDKEVQIAFNAGFIKDGVAAVREKEISLQVVDSLKPGLIRGVESSDYLYVLMPVRT